jgi:hypothetical protein
VPGVAPRGESAGGRPARPRTGLPSGGAPVSDPCDAGHTHAHAKSRSERNRSGASVGLPRSWLPVLRHRQHARARGSSAGTDTATPSRRRGIQANGRETSRLLTCAMPPSRTATNPNVPRGEGSASSNSVNHTEKPQVRGGLARRVSAPSLATRGGQGVAGCDTCSPTARLLVIGRSTVKRRGCSGMPATESDRGIRRNGGSWWNSAGLRGRGACW